MQRKHGQTHCKRYGLCRQSEHQEDDEHDDKYEHEHDHDQDDDENENQDDGTHPSTADNVVKDP